MDFINMGEGMGKWQTVINVRIPQNATIFLTRWGNIIFSKTILLHVGPYVHSYPQIHIRLVSLKSVLSKFIPSCTHCRLRTEGRERYWQVAFHLFSKRSQGENIVCHKV